MIFHLSIPGPGLAIRVICAEEPYVCKDFPETNNILKIVADFSASVKKVPKLLNANVHESHMIVLWWPAMRLKLLRVENYLCVLFKE